MVKNLLAIFLVLVATVAYGQLTISIDPATVHGEGSVGESDIAAHAYITNTSDTTVNLIWTRYETEKPENWLTWICDAVACYTPNIGATPPNRANELRPGEQLDFQIHASAQGVEGFAQVDIDIFDESDAETALGSITATFEAGTSTSTSDVYETASIRVYPNPTTDYFRIYQSDGVAQVEVYSIVGKRVRSYPAQGDGYYDVASLTEGLYLVRLLDRNNTVIKTVRLSKG